MPTNQDEQKAADEAASAQEHSNTDSSQEASPPKSARKILIGSQRDEADPNMGTQKTIRDASLSPAKVGNAIQVVEKEATDSVGAVESTISESVGVETVTVAALAPATETTLAVESAVETDSLPPVPEQQPQVDSPVIEQIPAVDSIDAELEAALGDLQMDSLLGAEQPVVDLEIDSRIKALVTRIHNDNVFFSLKGRYEGIASKRQFKTAPEEGAMLEVIVRGFKEDEGLYEVSIPGASVSIADWSDLVEGAVIEAKVTGSNTGGLELNVNNIRGFMPASQIDIVRVENFGDYVNQRLQCVVTELNPGRKRLVLSRRAILEREKNEKKQELLKTLAAGQTLDGIVTKLMDFGAFVDIGGVEGLVHVSKMSWERVGHPSEVFETGQKISVKVEKITAETGKISLSYRDTLENPWTNIDRKYPEGSVIEGTVSRLAQFGAFVKLEPGVEGLIHISELAHHRVMAVKNVVNQGDLVQVKILSVDPQAQKIGLSLKATLAKPEKLTGKSAAEDPNEPLRESVVKKRDEPLKGGHDKGSGGEQFGLNW